MLASELRSEVIKTMRGISGSSQKNKGLAGAAPIQNFKLHTRFNGDHLNFVRR
jgi:hypothetical protein